jgi:acetyl-CoA C-acetyltransferase
MKLGHSAFISAYKRTPIGKFMGSLSSVSAVQLGITSLLSALECTELTFSDIDEAIIGSMLGGQGQSPARQVALGAGLNYSTICTTINKACSSSMKAVTFAAQSIALGHSQTVVAGGIENMSQAPFFLDTLRSGQLLGHTHLKDLLQSDGVFCKHSGLSMGRCSERTISKYGITRADQDAFCAESYRRANDAWKRGFFDREVVPVEVKSKGKSEIVKEDDEYKKVNYEKISTLRPVFEKDGTITAANASGFNDGAAMVVVMSQKALERTGMKPIARVLGYADAEVEPVHFGTAPAGAMKTALERAGLGVGDVDLWEINENFSSIALVNMKTLGIDHSKVNVNGGAVALGHPFATSGARIICTLLNSLKEQQKTIGCASICNGGGGGTAIVVELLN